MQVGVETTTTSKLTYAEEAKENLGECCPNHYVVLMGSGHK